MAAANRTALDRFLQFAPSRCPTAAVDGSPYPLMNSTTDMPTDAEDLTPDEGAELIVLAPYIRQAQRLVHWYEAFADKDSPLPDIADLDEIVVDLKALPPLPGQLGEDLELIASGGGGDKATIINAINRLRRLAALDLTAIEQDGEPGG